MLFFFITVIITWLAVTFFARKLVASRELGRFSNTPQDVYAQLAAQYRLMLLSFGSKKDKKHSVSYQAAKAEREMSKKLQAAGLESPVEQGRFFLIRTVCAIGGPGLGLTGYHYLPTYYATLLMITCSAIGLVMPILWLKSKTSGRNEDIQRELPLVLDLTNLGTSAGWDVAASLERVIDVLHKEFPNHPLLKEFKRARWLTASGYTWEEALDRVSKRLALDSVRRSTLALGQAMKQGGDRTSQLEGIAEDAQRNYYSELDKRLATLPVKVLLITMGLLIAYFIIILAPAAVQIKRILFG